MTATGEPLGPAGNTAARWISILGHPFAPTLILVFGAALQLRSPAEALQTSLLVAVVALLPVGALMAYQVRRGSWAHADASNRAERPLLFAVAIVALAVMIGAVLWFRPGSFLIRGAIGSMSMLAACAILTRWVKVSLHMAFAALAATALLFLGSPLGWVLLAAMPALAWSRLVLNRHKPIEVALGVLVGIAFGCAIATL
jgi:hypothetical protein